MFHIKQIAKNKIRVYLHESCEFDIHFICRDLMNNYDEGNGAEYIADNATTATIAFF